MKRTNLRSKDALALKDFYEKVRSLLGSDLRKMALFGSKAEGRDTPESDIDVLVLIKDSAFKKKYQILDLAFEVNLKHAVYISPRVIALSQYQHPLWKTTAFLKKIREQGIAL